MKEKLVIPVIIGIVMVSGCTELNLTTDIISYSDVPYETFQIGITTADCHELFDNDYPDEEGNCWIEGVNFQEKTYDCKCSIGGII